MAEYTIDIARVRGKVTYAAAPTLDAGSLPVIVVKQTIDYSDPGTSTGNHYSSLLPGGPFIPATQLPDGSVWHIQYSGTMGSDNPAASPFTTARVFLLDSRLTGTDRVWAFAGGKGPYPQGTTTTLPQSGRTVNCAGEFYYVANGTALEFNFTNRSGAGNKCYFSGFEIIATPADAAHGWAATDLSYTSLTPDHSDPLIPGINSFTHPGSGGAFTTVLTNTFVAPKSDDYLIVVSGVANTSNTAGGQLEYRMMEDGVQLRSIWKKQAKDNTDMIPFTFLYVRSYAQGQSVVMTLEGKQSVAGTSRLSYHPRMMVYRLGALSRYQYAATSTSAIPVTAVGYGNWQTVLTRSFTPLADTGEYVLVRANLTAWRTDLGAMIARLVDETGAELHSFECTTNTLGTDYDRATIYLSGASLANTAKTYSLQVCQPDGALGVGFVSTANIVATGMTINTAIGVTHNIGIDDLADGGGTGMSSDVLTSTGGGGATILESMDDSAQNSVSVVDVNYQPVTGGTPALVRPRLWFYNNDRLAYLRTRTAGAQYTRWQNVIGSAPLTQTWQHILKWKVTQNAADLTAAKDKYFGPTGVFSNDIVMLLWGTDHSDSGFNYRFIMRDLALALDWFYNDAGVDQLTVTQRDMLRNAMLVLSYAKTQTRANAIALDPALGTVGSYLDWANTDTHNNHFYDMMMGATYGACSLYGESPTTFKYKPGAANAWLSGTTYQFTIPYHIYSGNPANYNNLWDWVTNRVESMMIPTLDTDIVGGFSEEGTNYGLSSAVYMTEMFNILNTCANRNYVGTHRCFEDHGYFQLYSAQPGVTNQVNLGDHPNNPVGRALIVDRNRLCALEVVDALPSSPVAPYLQYWLNHKMTAMSEGQFEPWDFLLYRDTRPETNITGLPLHYVASGTGFWNSRDTFADTGVSVSMSACSHGEEHHHSDFGALQIYRGDSPNPGDAGFLIIDINMASTIGNNWDLIAHSTDSFATSAFPDGWSQQYFGTPPVAPPPPGTAPPAPNLLSPADAATGVTQPITFSWAASTGATQYAIQVSLNLNFTALVLDIQNITSTSYLLSSTLSTGTVYYWRVSATNTGGTSAWSNVFSFTTAGTGGGGGAVGVRLVEDTSSMQIFPVDNWWNLDVSGWSPDASSATIISQLNTKGLAVGDKVGGFHPDWGTVNSTYGIPYIGVDGTQPLVPMTFTNYGNPAPWQSDYGQPGRPAGYPIPNEAKNGSATRAGWREENGDNHLIVFDRDNMLLYEVYKATWNGTNWGGSNGACFQMNTNNRRPETWTSTDAAGLAVFPGLVKYDDMFSGNPIRHATRFSTISVPANYYYPASHSGSADPAPSWPLGMRIRLKASFNITTFVAQFTSLSVAKRDALARLLQAFKTYGCIQADRGSHGYFQGTMDSRWVDGEYNQAFKALKWTDFEVLTLGRIS